jgi:polyhydroxybutyrate depolymerase
MSEATNAQPRRARPNAARAAEKYVLPVRRQFTVEGVERHALVFAPRSALDSPAPVVFAFHGHGGTAQQSAEMFGYHQAWEEAIVVYPQGLPTPTNSDPAGKKPGWTTSGSKSDNRDLKFFDVMLGELKKEFQVDDRRIYASGTSNGGFFTYTLWGARPDVLAAVAPAAATTRRLEDQLTPKPVFLVAGEMDPVVKIESQRATIEFVRKLNNCGEGRPGRRPAITNYQSPDGNTVASFIHSRGHGFPEEASQPIVEFFKRHAARERSATE